LQDMLFIILRKREINQILSNIMKLYLSSYKIGTEENYLISHIKEVGASLGYIPNALDFTNADPEKRKEHITSDVESLTSLGFKVEILDLKDYFGAKEKLEQKLSSLDALWVSGGNTFVLRQAMMLSALDVLMQTTLSEREDFLYAGYSAGICVLSPELYHLQIVDSAEDFPYEEVKETIWIGLDIIDFAILPHYDSDHPESKLIDEEVKYCIDNKILFMALRDGEVILEGW